jgi:tetratricopeptide (TPR) repeat protein
MKMFKKKEVFKVKSMPIDPASIAPPTTADEFQHRGMAYYARKQYEAAESDLKQAISLDAKNIDAFYSLGMVLKAVKRNDDAVKAFKQVIDLVSSDSGADHIKFDMIRRLALGHINEITQGDWNLEKEIWKRT